LLIRYRLDIKPMMWIKDAERKGVSIPDLPRAILMALNTK
jgi:hypothetical protein